MTTVYPTITINVLINYLNNDKKLFEGISDFNFMIPLADKLKKRGCMCGLGGDFAAATHTFNEIVQNLKPETIEILKKNFNTNNLCFGVQTKLNYGLKCY
jgi:hypothetical protein